LIVMNDSWLEMASNAIEMAKENRSVEDYKRFCNLVTPQVGKSFYDRIRVCEFLISEGILGIADGRLCVASRTLPNWLEDGLASGNESYWELGRRIYSDDILERKMDYGLLASLGLEGEEFVFDFLIQHHAVNLHEHIVHVSLKDDSLGFDIAGPKDSQAPGHLLCYEVKTSSRVGSNFRFIISRNEAETAKKLGQNWILVAIEKVENVLSIVGHLTIFDIYEDLPIDSEGNGTWQACAITLPKQSFRHSIPLS
jgi:hypothetical protein